MYMDSVISEKLAKRSNSPDFGYDQKVDIYYEMLIGTSPFNPSSLGEHFEMIQDVVYTIPGALLLSKETISFINGIMQRDL